MYTDTRVLQSLLTEKYESGNRTRSNTAQAPGVGLVKCFSLLDIAVWFEPEYFLNECRDLAIISVIIKPCI